jgi:hypothetical protein
MRDMGVFDRTSPEVRYAFNGIVQGTEVQAKPRLDVVA